MNFQGKTTMFDPLMSKTRILLFSASSFVVGVGAAAVLGWSSLTATPTIIEAPQVTLDEVRPAVELSDAFVNISRAVTPAVIRIEAEMPAQALAMQRGQGNPQALPPGFEDLFPNFPGFPELGPESMEMVPQTASGSGFIISPDGYILTNNHVVAGSTRITVFLADRRQYTAELVGRDPTTDVAVIKINGSNLPVLSLGSSADVRVGEWVLAVGNPGFGGGSSSLDYTVTAGIVSAIGRPLRLISSDLRMREGNQAAGFAIEDFIQTDAVINPGNSGGPLVNMMGQVVGINSAIASQTGYYQGYGFAIPMDLAKRIMEDLIAYGEIRRPYLGIMMESMFEEDAEVYGLPRTTGVLVQDAPAGGPAAAAGIRQEDVIVSIDGTPVERTSQLQLLIAQKRPGDEVTVGFYRDRQLRELRIRLGEIPAEARVATRVPEAAATAAGVLGIQVRAMTEQIARSEGFSDSRGVVIGGVTTGGLAQRRGLFPGMRVVSVNQEEVGTLAEVQRALDDVSPGEIVSLRVEHPRVGSRVVNIRIPQ